VKARFGAWRRCSEADRLANAEFFELKRPQGQEGKAMLETLLEIMGGIGATRRRML
jgi:hypothetical protein